MSQHVVFLERQSVRADVRRPRCATTYVEHDTTAPDQVIERLRDATVAIINKVVLRDATLAQLPKLKLIVMAATGYDCIEVEACRKRGIALANIRNYAVHTVPEHVFAMVLALRRNLLAYRHDVERGVWQKSEQFCFMTHPIGDLHGSTIGIIGEGAIGQGTAAIARGFGMKVLFADHEPPKAPGVEFTPLQQVLETSDVISLHLPMTAGTRNMIGLEQMRRMKRNALLINTARGGLVDERALIQALEQGLDQRCLLYTSPSPRDGLLSRMPSSA